MDGTLLGTTLASAGLTPEGPSATAQALSRRTFTWKKKYTSRYPSNTQSNLFGPETP